VNDLLRLTASALICGASLLGCSSQGLDSPDDAGGGNGGTAGTGASAGNTPTSGGGGARGVVDIYTPKTKVAFSATALAFNPMVDGELWVTLRQFPSDKPCAKDGDAGCAALPGVMAVITHATGDAPSAVIKEDGNAWHFMRRPSAVAWGDGLLFAACGEARTDNFENEKTPYSGPVLWSSDPAIFGVKPTAQQNGTHLDMLHETPYCMGIGHESANAFWAFNGDAGSLDRVDFHGPHAIGGADHSDGEVKRYIDGQLLRVPEVPSHLVYDSKRKLVYVADTGHGRVLSVDPSTATAGADIQVYETLQSSGTMDGATVAELVPPGLLRQPSGIALANDELYVTDNATSLIYVFDITGTLQHTYDTELPPGSLAGIALGPDSKLYVTDLSSGAVHRVEVAAK
jgi:DNA-binding beta-propeller fold protein YncE